MATNTTPTTEETFTTIPERPACVPEGAAWVGRDDAGREHYQHGALPQGRILVVDGGEVVESLSLPTFERETETHIATVAEWDAYVAQRCGWDVRAGDTGLVERLAARMEGQA
jgi:hypothetical protein